MLALILSACGADPGEGEDEAGVRDDPRTVVACNFDFQCDDNNDCTADQCQGGICHFPAVPNGIPCNDDDACTNDDVCQGGVCVPGSVDVCTDPIPLDCKALVCSGFGSGCVTQNQQLGAICEDGDPCTAGETCDLFGNCQGGMMVPGCGGMPDAGVADGGLLDAGVPDAGALDAGPPDAGAPDAGGVDAAVPDASGISDAAADDAAVPAPDAAVADAAAPEPDASASDPDADLLVPDAGMVGPDGSSDVTVSVDVHGGGGCSVVESGRGSWRGAALWVVVGVLLLHRRRGHMRLLAGAVAVCVTGHAATAAAQVPPGTPAERIDVGLWRPGTWGGAYLMGEGARLGPPGEVTAGVFLDVADRPLVAVVREGETTRELAIVESSVRLDLVAAYALTSDIQIGALVPLMASQAGTLDGLGEPASGRFTLGDVSLDARYAIQQGYSGGLAVAAALGLSLPTGSEEGWASQGSFGLRPRLLVEAGDRRGGIAAGVGLILRSGQADVVDLGVQHELELTLSGRWQPRHVPVYLVGELFLRLGLDNTGASQSPIEALGGLGWRADEDFELIVAAGGGLTDGYGTPSLRVVAGVRVTLPSVGD